VDALAKREQEVRRLERRLSSAMAGPARRILRPYRAFRRRIARRDRWPAVYNVNGANEATHPKSALLVHLIRPFVLDPDDPAFVAHQSLTTCKLMATGLGELGYVVDAVQQKDLEFRPARPYDLVIGTRLDWRGLDAMFGENAVRVFLAVSQNHAVHNSDLRRRYDDVLRRRGRELEVRKLYTEAMPALAGAHAVVAVGNDVTAGTWKQAFDRPVYPFNNLGFPDTRFAPEAKDYAEARRHFLFFASKNQVRKGLDLLLEVFAELPELHLYVCSSFQNERDFCALYERELYGTPNIHPLGWIRANGPEFDELVRRCAYVVHPSCSEGQAGAVVQCMHAGLIPLVTSKTGIDTEDFGVTLADDSLEEIRRTILEVSERPATWHREGSARTHAAARAAYTEESFRERWREIVTEIAGSAVPSGRA
jgi:glycosyltransferase involved in cell wall biosynthesis